MKECSKKSWNWLGFDTETQDGKAILVCTEKESLVFPTSFEQIVYWMLSAGTLSSKEAAAPDPTAPYGKKKAREVGDELHEEWEESAPKAFDADGRIRYASYNMDYDVRAIMAFLPISVRSKLAVLHACHYGPFRISYIPRKFFLVKHDYLGSFECFDMAQYFAKSLRKAAVEILGDEKTGEGLDMKQMARELRTRPAYVIEYCKHDADLVRRLAEYLDLQFSKLGVPFDRPISSGYLFRIAFRDRLRFALESWEQAVARRGYHGGRVEVFKRGYIKGPVTLWDINSAYPAVLAVLQDPRGCILQRTKKYTPENVQYGTYLIEGWFDPNVVKVAPLPVRLSEGGTEVTKYPTGLIRAWVDRPTLELARECGEVRVIDAWEYILQDVTRELLFPEIPKLYKQRKKVKSMSLAIKLLLNAGYGKLASEVTDWRLTRKIGPDSVKIEGKWYRKVSARAQYTHVALAAHVTGTVRAWATRALWSVPYERCIFTATDSVCLVGSDPPTVPTGGKLGEWSLKGTYKAAVVVGSGVYALQESDGTWRSWVRGFERGISLPASLKAAEGNVVKTIVKRTDSLRETVRTRHWENYNIIREVVRDMKVNFDTKRVWSGRFRTARGVLKTVHTSEPYPLLPDNKRDLASLRKLLGKEVSPASK